MSRNYKIRDQEKPYFISFATVNWIDVFIRPLYKDYCIKEKGLVVYAWVIMSNHVHMVIGTRKDDMQDILRDLKRHTSKAILKAIKENIQESRKEWMLMMFEQAGKRNSNNRNYQFWQQNNKLIELNSNDKIDQKINYIHNNPVMNGIVFEAQEYKYSSAIDYSGYKGLIDIEKV